ncbi:MAG: hypothetical protein VB933_00490 [Pseudomonadales bacterium]
MKSNAIALSSPMTNENAEYTIRSAWLFTTIRSPGGSMSLLQ